MHTEALIPALPCLTSLSTHTTQTYNPARRTTSVVVMMLSIREANLPRGRTCQQGGVADRGIQEKMVKSDDATGMLDAWRLEQARSQRELVA